MVSDPTRLPLSKQAIILVAGRTASFSFAFLVPLCLVRLYPKAEFGVFQQALLLFDTFHPILQLGVTSSLLYFYPRDFDLRNALLNHTLWFLCSVGILFCLILLVFQNQVADYFHNPAIRPLVPLVGVYVGLMLSSSFLEMLYIVEEQVSKASLVLFLTGFFRFAFLIGLSLIVRETTVLVVALIVVAMMRMVVLIRHLAKHYHLGILDFNWAYLKTQLGYSIPFGIATAFMILNMTIDKYVISYFFDAEIYAIYIVGCFQIPVISLIFNPVVNILLPHISRLQKDNEIQKLHAVWKKAASRLSLVGFPFVVMFSILAHDIIVFLFTDSYRDAIPIFMIFLLLLPRQVTSYGIVLRAYGQTKYISKVCFLSLVIAGVLMYPSLRLFGTIGPPIVVVLSLYLTAFLQLRRTKELLRVNWTELLPWHDFYKNFSVASLIGVALFLSGTFFSLRPILNIALVSGLFCAIFVVAAYWFRLIDERDKKVIASFISGFSLRGTTNP